MRFPMFLESYYRKIQPTEVDFSSVSQETQDYLKQANVTMDTLAKRYGPAEVYEDEDKKHFCAWLKHIGAYGRIIDTLCVLTVNVAMSIVLADRLGRLYAEDADIETVRSVDIDTWNIAVAANSAKQPRFGRFV